MSVYFIQTHGVFKKYGVFDGQTDIPFYVNRIILAGYGRGQIRNVPKMPLQ